jgi:hypothetical protein
MTTYLVDIGLLVEADSTDHARAKAAEYLGSLGDVESDERVGAIVSTANVMFARDLLGHRTEIGAVDTTT